MVLFVIQSKVPYLSNTFTSNATSLIPKSKSFIITINLISFTRTIIIVQKYSRTYQNEFDNKQMK